MRRQDKQGKSEERKSGLHKQELLPQDHVILTRSELEEQYKEFSLEYENLYTAHAIRKGHKAFLVTMVGYPELYYISFTHIKDRAKAEANKYFRTCNPKFYTTEGYYKMYLASRGRRVPEFDKYQRIGKVPILEIMQQGIKFPCFYCGKDNFSYEDYENHRCYILDDGTELNPYTQGVVLCYNCYKIITN